MPTSAHIVARQKQAADLIRQAGISFTEEEQATIEVANFGLGNFEETGLGVLVYVNTERCCAKELAMWPGQTCRSSLHADRAMQKRVSSSKRGPLSGRTYRIKKC